MPDGWSLDGFIRDATDDNGVPLAVETFIAAQLPGDTCPACEGKGRVVVVIAVPLETEKCRMCKGSGAR